MSNSRASANKIYVNASLTSAADNCLKVVCSESLFLPDWKPVSTNTTIINRAGRTAVLLSALLYIFIGLSIVCDTFYMAADMLVSRKRKVKVISKVTGTPAMVSIPIWNDVVINLVMFSVAPEMLLSIIETFMTNFEIGEVGNMVLLGGAFNLFLTVGICILSPKQAKKIDRLLLFFHTVGWGAFAYAWLYIILVPSSPDAIDLWEAILTLSFYPIMIVSAYLVDRKYFGVFHRMWRGRNKPAIKTNKIRPSSGISSTISSTRSSTTLSSVSTVSSSSTESSSSSLSSASTSSSTSSDSNSSRSSTSGSTNDYSSYYSSYYSSDDGQSEKGGKEEDEDDDEDEEAKKRDGVLDEDGFPLDEVEKAKMDLEERQIHFLKLAKKLRAKHKNLPSSKIYELAEAEIIKEMPKSMSYYRMLASKGLDVLNKNKHRGKGENAAARRFEKPNEQLISFDPVEYRVMEDVGTFDVSVIREGERLNNTISVSYVTEDGTGVSGTHYFKVKGKLLFKPGEKLKKITIGVVNEDVYTLDTTFFVTLFDSEVVDRRNDSMMPDLKLDPDLRLAVITKMSDDHGGIFQFDREGYSIEEDVGEAKIKINRNGNKRNVLIQYRIIPDSALIDVHFKEHEDMSGLIRFEEGQTEGFIRLLIVNEEKLEKTVIFRIELDEPFFEEDEGNMADDTSSRPRSANSMKKGGPAPSVAGTSGTKPEISRLGAPRLGQITSTTITITENVRLKKAVENISSIDLTEMVSSASWASQFAEALHVPISAAINEDDEDKPENSSLSIPTKPSRKDYLIHFMTVFWKILFAFIPPAKIWKGTASFIISFLFICGLMALAGDVATQLGCAIGLKIEMTAVTFIAMGVSLPDFFASRLAATKEEHADAAIGESFGKVPVGIFVGFGLSLTTASAKATVDGRQLKVTVKELPFNAIFFLIYAGVAIITLMLRRLPPIRGEIGGPRTAAVLSAMLFFLLWLSYFVLFALQSYCVTAIL